MSIINDRECVFDTSAIFTYIEDESGADTIEDCLVEAESGNIIVHVSFISLTEIFYITLREKGEKEALERVKLVKSLAVTLQESDEKLNLLAGTIKSKNRLSLADAYIAALSQYHNATLVHKDPEFEKLAPLIKEHRLPYKKSS